MMEKVVVSNQKNTASMTSVRRLLWASILLVTAALITASLGILQKHGVSTDAGEGLASDLVRHLPFVAVGLLLRHQGASLTAVAVWVGAVNFIDKAIVGLSLGVVSQDAAAVPFVSLGLGIALIWLATVPVAFFLAAASYSTHQILAVKNPISTSAQARFLVYCALGAISVPFVHAVSGYVLLRIYDFPLFLLSSSYRLVPVLELVFVSGAAIALCLYSVASTIQRRAHSFPMIVFGLMLLLLAIFISLQLNIFAFIRN